MRGVLLGAGVVFGGILYAAATASGTTAVTPAPTSSAATAAYRYPLAGTSTYFVMTDRYANGSTANDNGGLGSNLNVSGFDPTSSAYFHGGDLKGLTGACTSGNGLARIKALGFTSIWITPPFGQNTVQGGSAAYHGYWINKFDQIDPHWGTMQDFANFTLCAKKLGIKVIIDVVVNHTGDVIQYGGLGGNSFVTTPYKDANGNVFDPATYATVGSTTFPDLNANSFPKVAYIPPSLANAKSPAWLNDVTNYHNRGDINWNACNGGTCFTWGDFFGLDDLFTEKYTVMKGLADVYGSWAQNYPIAGFRIDTAPYVDYNFFKRWLPIVQADAALGGTNNPAGTKNFTAFGEDYTVDMYNLASQLRNRGLPSVLDFSFQDHALNYVAGIKSARSMWSLFNADDLYTTATTNAYSLQTFLGNHDMGRIGCLLQQDGFNGKALLQRDLFAHSLLMLLRGNPVVYYGDEVGMTGGGSGDGCGDKGARQDMFQTKVVGWQSETRIGGSPIGLHTAFQVTATNPIAKLITSFNAFRAKYPAFKTGAQITRLQSNGVFAVSRIDAKARVEYVAAFNNGSSAKVNIPTSTPGTKWVQLTRSDRAVTSKDVATTDSKGLLKGVTVPSVGWVVFKATKSFPAATPKVTSLTIQPDPANPGSGLYAAQANVVGTDPSTVTFLTQVVGTNTWTLAGVDDAAPYRIYLDPASYPQGAQVAVQALVRSSSGKVTRSPVQITSFQ